MHPDQLPIHSDPEIMGGTPVFVDTRVPVQTLLEYLEAGDPLDEFLEDFPSVSREQAIAVLELAKEMLVAPFLMNVYPGGSCESFRGTLSHTSSPKDGQAVGTATCFASCARPDLPHS